MKFFRKRLTWICFSMLCAIQGMSMSGYAEESTKKDRSTFGSQPGILLHMAGNPSIQTDLGLDDGKKKSIEKLYQELKEINRNCNCGDKNISAEERKAKSKKCREKSKELDEKAKAILSDKEILRMRQIVWQQAGPLGLSRFDDLTNSLNLSDAKKNKIQDILDKFEKEGKKLMNPKKGERPDFEALEKARKGMLDGILGVLSDEEHRKYKELLGKPYKCTSPDRD